MNVYRIESYSNADADRGALQHVETDIIDPMEVLLYCTEPWRSRSLHLAYRVDDRGREHLFRAYLGGVNVAPHLR